MRLLEVTKDFLRAQLWYRLQYWVHRRVELRVDLRVGDCLSVRSLLLGLMTVEVMSLVHFADQLAVNQNCLRIASRNKWYNVRQSMVTISLKIFQFMIHERLLPVQLQLDRERLTVCSKVEVKL